MKIVNIEGENLLSSERLEDFQWDFQERRGVIRLKVTKRQLSTLSL